MKRLVTLIAGLAAAAVVHAAPFRLIDATVDGNPPDPGFGNVAFSLTYEDGNLDGLFSLAELLSFTGYSDGMSFFDMLLAVPDANGVMASSAANEWRFGDGINEVAFGAGRFTPFTQSAGNLSAAGSAWLVGAALLAGLAVPRRRRVG